MLVFAAPCARRLALLACCMLALPSLLSLSFFPSVCMASIAFVWSFVCAWLVCVCFFLSLSHTRSNSRSLFLSVSLHGFNRFGLVILLRSLWCVCMLVVRLCVCHSASVCVCVCVRACVRACVSSYLSLTHTHTHTYTHSLSFRLSAWLESLLFGRLASIALVWVCASVIVLLCVCVCVCVCVSSYLYTISLSLSFRLSAWLESLLFGCLASIALVSPCVCVHVGLSF